MEMDDFDALKVGDTVVNDETGKRYTVVAKHCWRPVLVPEAVIATNPSEWTKVEEAGK